MAPKYFEKVGLTEEHENLAVEELVPASLLMGQALHDIRGNAVDLKKMREDGIKTTLRLDLDDNDTGFIVVLLRFDVRSVQG